MNNITKEPEQVFFLSEVLGVKIVLPTGKKIGRLSDIVIIDREKIAEATHLYVTRSYGYPSLLIPWEKIRSLNDREIVADIEKIEAYEKQPTEDSILLRDHIMDKRVLDMDDSEVEVVYDIKLVLKNKRLYVSEVDLSRYGLLRRIGMKGLANFIYGLADKIKTQTIAWTYIQPLPTDISSFRGDVKLKVLKDKLSEIHPVDLADILEELDHEQRIRIFGQLETEHASDTLEEIEPNVQRDLIASLTKEKVAELLSYMTPGQAADILSVLPHSEARRILKMLKKEDADKIHSILKQQEGIILNFSTTNILKLTPEKTAREVRDTYARLAKGKDVVMYLYIADDQDKLLGVIDIKELLEASADAQLKDVMIDKVIALEPDNTIRDAYNIFSRYDFRAIPITNKKGKLLGVIPYRDIMKLKHRFL